MGENTKIEWADHTFNPWTGCTKVSPGCDHCYAEGWSKRSGLVEWGPHGSRRRTSPANWRKPLKWDAEAKAAGVRKRVFCASLADVFDNHGSIASGWRGDLWHLIARTTNLDWLLLTKRPQNIAKTLPDCYGAPAWGDGWANVWLGTTVENQAEADRRIPHLLSVPASVRFLSCEPLLGPLDLTPYLWGRADPCPDCQMDADCDCGALPRHMLGGEPDLAWAICGGESGHGARPMHPDWARDLRDQFRDAGVPFFFKQWGEWMPWEMGAAPMWNAQNGESEDRHLLFPADMDVDPKWDDGLAHYHPGDTGHAAFQRVGKARAGRLLDGREWNEVPA